MFINHNYVFSFISHEFGSAVKLRIQIISVKIYIIYLRLIPLTHCTYTLNNLYYTPISIKSTMVFSAPDGCTHFVHETNARVKYKYI